jgi:hypothetical protein
MVNQGQYNMKNNTKLADLSTQLPPPLSELSYFLLQEKLTGE